MEMFSLSGALKSPKKPLCRKDRPFHKSKYIIWAGEKFESQEKAMVSVFELGLKSVLSLHTPVFLFRFTTNHTKAPVNMANTKPDFNTTPQWIKYTRDHTSSMD